jgi:agmatine deiminase
MRMPAETSPHERSIMGWPCRPELWKGRIAEGRQAYAEVVRAIARFEPVTLLARERDIDQAADLAGAQNVEIVAYPLDDSWLRDTGPIYLTGHDGRVATDWIFNGWGGKYEPHDDDDAIPAFLTHRWSQQRTRLDMVLEGGSIAVDGVGTLVTTEQCLLHPNRNPDLTRTEIEHRLKAALGVDVVIWLPFGVDDRDTDGHVDLVTACAQPGLWIFQGCDDVDDPEHVRLDMSRRALTGSTDAAGNVIEVVELPVLPYVELDGERLAVPYLNYYACNGALIVPVTGHEADDEMLALLAAAHPDREIVPVDGRWIAFGGGGPHCITQQVPVG